jgi:hypothetical protein
MRKTELIKLVGTVITKNLKSLELRQKRPLGGGEEGLFFTISKQDRQWIGNCSRNSD